MDKLQFDSFHKFLVSLGTILIIGPLTLLHFLVSGSYDIIMSQKDYDSLSAVSIQYLDMKSTLLFTAFKYAPYILGVLAVFGVALVVIGCIHWRINQHYLDKDIKHDSLLKEHQFKKMTQPEIVSNIQKESQEIVINNTSQIVTNSTVTPPTRSDIEQLYARITTQAYEFISNILGNDYIVQKYVRMIRNHGISSDAVYDIVALSKRNEENYIYEVKWLPGNDIDSLDGIKRVNSNIKYLNKNQQKKYVFCPVIFIASPDFSNVRAELYAKLYTMGIEKEHILIFQYS